MDIKMKDGKVLFQNGRFYLTDDYIDSVAQRLYIRLKSNYGKWFWNTQYGVDWFGKVFGKAKNKTRIDLLLRETITKDKFVESITSFPSEINRETRTYSCEFSVKIKQLEPIQQYTVITTQDGFTLLTSEGRVITTR